MRMLGSASSDRRPNGKFAVVVCLNASTVEPASMNAHYSSQTGSSVGAASPCSAQVIPPCVRRSGTSTRSFGWRSQGGMQVARQG